MFSPLSLIEKKVSILLCHSQFRWNICPSIWCWRVNETCGLSGQDIKVVAGGLFFIGLVVVGVSLLGCAGVYFESRCFIIFVSITYTQYTRELLWCYKSLLLTFPSFLFLSVSVLLNRHHTGSDFHHLCAIYTKGEGKSLLIQKAKTQLTSNSLETFAKNLYIKQVV